MLHRYTLQIFPRHEAWYSFTAELTETMYHEWPVQGYYLEHIGVISVGPSVGLSLWLSVGLIVGLSVGLNVRLNPKMAAARALVYFFRLALLPATQLVICIAMLQILQQTICIAMLQSCSKTPTTPAHLVSAWTRRGGRSMTSCSA